MGIGKVASFTIEIKEFADKWGPEKIIQVYDPETQMKGVLVIDNTALGPGKGGISASRFICSH